ncbi:DIP1984 family protein [uncultured Brachyspira sp.]|uniref:DIP1984 family protein n=1 Tax=uncultured Brachyspira sp. TaxID=221953 RepID=UPI0026394572|nr:DIP1984 family protein [uncultured Brachyspira sp.]
MKLGEALLKRDEYIKRQDDIKKRIKSNVVLRDDNENNENPNDLIKEYIDINNELSDLIMKIENKEHEIKLDIGISISEAVNIRDKLYRELEIYKTVLKELNSKEYRNAKNEIKMKVLVNVKDIQNEADKISKAYSDIDVMIQAANWNADLK